MCLLINHFQNKLASGSRLCSTNPGCGLKIIYAAWSDMLQQGIRLDIVNVQAKLLPYYKRMGYISLPNFFFTHPVWHTPSYVMVLPADDGHKSKFKDLFMNIKDPVPIGRVFDVLSLSTV